MRIFPPFLWHSIGLGSFLMNINMNLNSQGAREWLTGLDWLTEWLTGWQNDWLPGQVHIRWPGNYLQQQQSLNAEWSECASNEPRGAEGQRGRGESDVCSLYTLHFEHSQVRSIYLSPHPVLRHHPHGGVSVLLFTTNLNWHRIRCRWQPLTIGRNFREGTIKTRRGGGDTPTTTLGYFHIYRVIV